MPKILTLVFLLTLASSGLAQTRSHKKPAKPKLPAWQVEQANGKTVAASASIDSVNINGRDRFAILRITVHQPIRNTLDVDVSLFVDGAVIPMGQGDSSLFFDTFDLVIDGAKHQWTGERERKINNVSLVSFARREKLLKLLESASALEIVTPVYGLGYVRWKFDLAEMPKFSQAQ
jgi:hypothetical protein